MYGLGDAALDAQLTVAAQQLHAAAASMGQLRAQYEATGDPRYIAGVQAILPVYRTALTRYSALSLQASGHEAPASYLQTLDDFSSWVLDTGKALTTAVVKTAETVPTVAKALPLVLVVAGVVGIMYLVRQRGR